MTKLCMECVNHMFQPYYKENGDVHDYCARTGEWVMCSADACECFDKIVSCGCCCGDD